MTEILEDISAGIGKLDSVNEIKQLVTDALSQGFSANDIVVKGVRKGLETVGEKYEAGEYFLSELLFAGSIVSDLLQLLKQSSREQILQRKGLVVLGTVRGDIHDIGKNIFKMLAESAGFEVRDLGVDVEPTVFVDEIRKVSPNVLALSALLTTSLVEMKNTVEAVKPVRTNMLKILLGGNAVKKEFAAQIGAEGALDAVEGVEICRSWTQ